jgi:dTDP-4-dehydrorhamnose reductase
MTERTIQPEFRAPFRIGVLGAAGQLGTCLVREIESSGESELAFAATRREIDLTDLDGLDRWLDETLDAPLDAVINAAAYTKVDACESEPELAYQVNALAPAAWARSLAERRVRFLHVSTDYVFSGDGDRPYRESDATDPRTVYGSSKRAGEVAVLGSHPAALVVRTSWVFGPGRNFVQAILRQADQRRRGEADGPISVVDDQVGSPTSAKDLASALVRICRSESERIRDANALVHLCNSGETSWYGFAREILARSGYDDIEIEPIATSRLDASAPRPGYSVLDCSRARQLGFELRPWEEALQSYLSGLGRSDFGPAESIRDARGPSPCEARG